MAARGYITPEECKELEIFEVMARFLDLDYIYEQQQDEALQAPAHEGALTVATTEDKRMDRET